jgi:hypothetical protein
MRDWIDQLRFLERVAIVILVSVIVILEIAGIPAIAGLGKVLFENAVSASWWWTVRRAAQLLRAKNDHRGLAMSFYAPRGDGDATDDFRRAALQRGFAVKEISTLISVWTAYCEAAAAWTAVAEGRWTRWWPTMWMGPKYSAGACYRHTGGAGPDMNFKATPFMQ